MLPSTSGGSGSGRLAPHVRMSSLAQPTGVLRARCVGARACVSGHACGAGYANGEASRRRVRARAHTGATAARTHVHTHAPGHYGRQRLPLPPTPRMHSTAASIPHQDVHTTTQLYNTHSPPHHSLHCHRHLACTVQQQLYSVYQDVHTIYTTTQL